MGRYFNRFIKIFLCCLLYIGILGTQANAQEQKAKIKIQWLGHNAFKITTIKGKVILIDPWFRTNPVLPSQYRTPEAFDKVDLILYTHGHVDHLMLSDLEPLVKKFNPKIVGVYELVCYIKTKIPMADCQTFVLANPGSTAEIAGIKIAMVEAAHSSSFQETEEFQGIGIYTGNPVGYILEFENGFKLYVVGDTGLSADMKFVIGEYYQPELAILPIGGVFTLGPKEAAFACKLMNPKYVIPCHFKTYPCLTQSTDEFVKYLNTYAPQVKAVVLEISEEAEF